MTANKKEALLKRVREENEAESDHHKDKMLYVRVPAQLLAKIDAFKVAGKFDDRSKAIIAILEEILK